MKRLVVTMFAIVLMFTLCSSSIFAGGLTGYGLKGGLNFANLHGDDVEDLGLGDLDSKMGLCLGGFVTYSISDMFAIQPEVLFTMKGAKKEVEVQGETLKVTGSLNYLEIPVLAKLSIPGQGSFVPNLFIGPYLAIKLSGKWKVEYAGASAETDIEDLKGTDFGVVCGAGVDLALGSSKVTVDARYTLGLTTIDASEWEADIKNGVFSLMVGYSL